MAWRIKQTVTEMFEVNTELLGKLWDMARPEEPSLDEALSMGGGPLARDAEMWLIDTFEMHNGSVHGAKLFSSLGDQDTGYELDYEED